MSNSLPPHVLYVHGILQARILEWVDFLFSRDLPNPGIKPRSRTLQVGSLPAEPQGKLSFRERLPLSGEIPLKLHSNLRTHFEGQML